MQLLDQNFYIYGAGIFGKALAQILIEQNLRPISFLDRSPRTLSFKDIPIRKFEQTINRSDPAEFKSFCEISIDAPVLVTVLGYANVEEEIEKFGFRNIISTFDVMRMFPSAVSHLNQCGFLWMKSPSSTQYNDDATVKFSSLLSDEKSISTLDKLISFRKSPCVENYPHPEDYEMYFPPDIPKLYDYETIKLLDVGSFDGDSLAGFYSRWPIKLTSYIGIEISQVNIDAFWKRIKDLQVSFNNLSIIKGAVGVPIGSKLVIEGQNSATCVKLLGVDDVCDSSELVNSYNLGLIAADMGCNILKMDIEGADFDALNQALGFISHNQPTLALSVYHHPEDLWRMALAVEKTIPGQYNWYLRQEGHWGLETICYGVPKSLNN